MASELGAHYWQGCNDGKLLYQRCRHCQRAQTYPRPFCHHCGHAGPEWLEASKKGKVSGATTVHRAPTEEFAALVPYRLLLVDLVEGTRVMAHGEMGLNVGDSIVIDFKKVGDRSLPFCRAEPL